MIYKTFTTINDVNWLSGEVSEDFDINIHKIRCLKTKQKERLIIKLKLISVEESR